MKRFLAIVLCVALLTALFSGCAEEKTAYIPTGDALDSDESAPTEQVADEQSEPKSVSLAYDPNDSFNPFLATTYTNRSLFSLIYQGLFTVNSDYEATPVLCKSYNVSADHKTYTFELQNATFSDGTSVTAADVVASLEAARTSNWYGGRLLHVSTISAYGETVVLELDTAMENLPILLDIPILKAAEIAADKPLGTGPYQLDGFQLKRQAGWWCSAALPIECDTIALYSGATAARRRDLFEFGSISMVCTTTIGSDKVDFHSDYELWDCETGVFLYLVVNSESYFFSNANIRTALTHAIDRDALVSQYYNDFAYSATLPASPLSPYYTNSLANDYGYDPDKFQDAIGDTAVEGGVLTMLVRENFPQRVKVAKAIAEQLSVYGLTVEVQEVSADDYTYLLSKGEYDLYLSETRLSANMDLSAFFATNGTLRYGGLSDPATYATCLEALADADNYYTLHEMIMESGWLCPILFQSCAIYSQRAAFENFAPARDAIFYYEIDTK